MFLAQGAHSATSVNWISISTVIVSVFIAVGGTGKWLITRLDRNRDRSEHFVTGQVDDVKEALTGVTDALAGRLDKVDDHLAEQDKTSAKLGERVAAIEGALGAQALRRTP